MNREEARARRKELGELALGTWAVAIVPNLLDAFGFEPEGWGWLALRIVLSTLFFAALCAWLIALVREWRVARTAR